ncbi:MAG: hypothetical protein JWP03_1416 [Phycisphaerales bacterium]|nr:hypothetical protein [Phycisphaerales bacterium]
MTKRASSSDRLRGSTGRNTGIKARIGTYFEQRMSQCLNELPSVMKRSLDGRGIERPCSRRGALFGPCSGRSLPRPWRRGWRELCPLGRRGTRRPLTSCCKESIGTVIARGIPIDIRSSRRTRGRSTMENLTWSGFCRLRKLRTPKATCPRGGTSSTRLTARPRISSPSVCRFALQRFDRLPASSVGPARDSC